ncbi:hypothetical protein EJD97_013913, partial [Solanum chilense]
EEESNVQSKNTEMTDGASSSSSRLREEAIQVATIEAEMDEFRHNRERDRNLNLQVGEVQRAANLQELVRGESQRIGEENIQAIAAEKLSSMAAAKSQSTNSRAMEAAQSSSGINRLDESRQKSVTGDSLQGLNPQFPQRGQDRGSRYIDSRQGIVMGESQILQAQGHREGNQQYNPSIYSQICIDNSNKELEIYQQHQQFANTTSRNTSSRIIVGSIHNNQGAGHSSELLRKQGNNQGNPNITTSNSDRNVQETVRLNVEPVGIQNYQMNFPKISTNFDRNTKKNVVDRNDPTLANTDKTAKKDQAQEPAPYTVIQTYADRLRFNQSQKGVSLTEPEITTKQGLPAVLFVKDEVVKELASTYKYTLIGKFIYTMPRVELIRKNFILQTQLSGGV